MKNELFEKHIAAYLDSLTPCLITDAMRYAMEGGKRFRPAIIFAILKGFDIEEIRGYDCALALEMIQTYSLIHDDLPAMDNDDLRRGKPSLHKAFREDIAILSGDQLLTGAFGVIADSQEYDPQTKANMISALSHYAGMDGMVYGQLLDVTCDSRDIDKDLLFKIQDNKTGGLFKIACLFPMYIAGIKKEQEFTRLGSLIGCIFQNQDDLFDLTRSEEQMGKNLSDQKNGKGTALSIYTKEELEDLIAGQFAELDGLLEQFDFDHTYLKELLEQLKER